MANQYANYQWRDDPARKISTQMATVQGPAYSQTAVAQGAQPQANDGVTGAPVANPWGAGGDSSRPFTVKGAAPAQTSFSSMLANAAPPREQNMAAAQSSISQLLGASGPSAEGQRALSDLDKQQAEQARQIKEQSALSGRLATGQNVGDSLRLSEKLMAQRADAEGQVAAADAERNNQRQQQGFSQFLGLEQLGQQSADSEASRELARAQMAQNERFKNIDVTQQDKQMAQQASQFASQQDFQKWALEQGWNQDQINRAWQSSEAEKGRQFTAGENALNRQFTAGESALDRAVNQSQFAQTLGLNKQQFAESIRQFNSKQDYDKWALQQGISQQEADRLWQSKEADKAREFTSKESALDRELNASQFKAKLGLDEKQLAENIRQFNSRQEFDTWAKNLDVSQADADRLWKAQQDDIQRKWQSGENLSQQEHEVFMQSLQEKAETARMNLNQVLNLQTLDQQNKYNQDLEVLRQNYENSRTTQGFSHEEAMQQMQADLQKQLQAQGFTNDQAMQAAQLQAQAIEADRNRAFEDKIQTAQLLQQNSQFLANFGLDKQKVDLQSKQIMADIANNAERLGMDKKEFEAALSNNEFNKSLQTASILTQQFGDSPEMLEKASDLVWEGLYKGGLVSQAEYEAGKLSAKASTFSNQNSFAQWATSQGADPNIVADVVKANTDTNGQWLTGTSSSANTTGAANGPKPGTQEAIQSAKDLLDSLAGKLPAGTNIQNLQSTLDGLKNLKPGGYLDGKAVNMGLAKLPGAKENIDYTNGYATSKAKTQAGADYYIYALLSDRGMPPQQAFDVASAVVGRDRMMAAHKALTGIDWWGT